jgi:hypothetical protein
MRRAERERKSKPRRSVLLLRHNRLEEGAVENGYA